MLHVYYGNIHRNVPYSKFVRNLQETFDAKCDVMWLFDEFAQEVIRAVDNAIVIPGGILTDIESGESFSIRDLSGGAKCALWLKYGYKSGIVHATFGDNVVSFIERIGMEKDIWLQMKYEPDWQFIDPAGIHFVGLPKPTRDWHVAADFFEARIEAIRKEEGWSRDTD